MAKQDGTRPLHSLALEAVRGLEPTRAGLALAPATSVRIREKLVLSHGSDELVWAVRSLLIVASRLSSRVPSRVPSPNGANAASALVELASTAAQALKQLAFEKASRPPHPALLKITVPKDEKPNRAVVDRLNRMPRRA